MLICESVKRALLTKCQIVSVLSFSLTTWWRLCLARKRAGQMENFTALLSVSIFLFRIINHYTLAPTFVFTKMIFANNLHCYLRNDCLVPANYKWTTSICQLRGFAWMVINTSEDFFNKPFKVSLKNEKRERFYNTAPSFGSLQWWTVERNYATTQLHNAPKTEFSGRLFFFRSEKVQQLATIGLPSNYN